MGRNTHFLTVYRRHHGKLSVKHAAALAGSSSRQSRRTPFAHGLPQYRTGRFSWRIIPSVRRLWTLSVYVSPLTAVSYIRLGILHATTLLKSFYPTPKHDSTNDATSLEPRIAIWSLRKQREFRQGQGGWTRIHPGSQPAILSAMTG